jgi:multiple sugar transport system permease protein
MASVTRPLAPPKKYSMRQVEISWGYLFISIWIVGFILFAAFPMAASLYLSFTDYTLGSEGHWVGTSNYRELLSLEFKPVAPGQSPDSVLSPGYLSIGTIPGTNTVVGATDPFFWKSLRVTLYFALLALPSSMAIALMLAVLTNLKLPLIKFYRTLYYIPSLIPAIAGAIIFRSVLSKDIGWLNISLGWLGIRGPDWLNDERLVLPGLAILGLWGVGNAMIIYLGGLQGVPTELYEAAKVDGAHAFRRFWSITLPFISPVILYNLVTGLIGTFQYFTVAYILTNGDGRPNYATYFYNIYLYKMGFAFGGGQMGMASAMAWILLVIVVMITAVVFGTSGNWVFYAGGRRG